jgi:hypothetical protein
MNRAANFLETVWTSNTDENAPATKEESVSPGREKPVSPPAARISKAEYIENLTVEHEETNRQLPVPAVQTVNADGGDIRVIPRRVRGAHKPSVFQKSEEE